MSEPNRVEVASFPNRVTAELAGSLLESHGISFEIQGDDAGGTYPPLSFAASVKLLVASDDESTAREILESQEPSEKRASRANPGDLWTGIGFLVALALGFAAFLNLYYS